MKRLSMRARLALVALATLGVLATAVATDYGDTILPFIKDGATWTRLSGTTNTKEDVTSHSHAMDVYLSGGTATLTPSGASQTDYSTTITTGGTFQQLIASSATRKSLEVQNVCAVAGNCTAVTNKCYVFIAASGTPSTANSVVLNPGDYYLRDAGVIPTDAIQATCAGNSDKIMAKAE